MNFIATILAVAFKTIWGFSLLVLVIGLVFYPIYSGLQKRRVARLQDGKYQKEKKKRKKLMDLKLGYWAFFKLFIIFSIPIPLIFGRHAYRPIVDKYGVETEAVVYDITDPGILINYQRIYKYHFVFKLPDSTYQKASLLETHMQRGYGSGQRITIKYLPLTASFYPVVIDIEE